ncbi:uncharacterized protein BX664DRAFT_355128 [Halteromyces radiatus]|uniref:uncharacterized protein n=1 Tax=Halteromyces radiatus TaxID=101107 RepID=UPI00221E3B12|nr:uncharacterized protein BX664DRAFT_355128 [Halteromyces radiatus]KAI8099734.1 hypothetical protein BX664DRAFT_355128 [Halteromyces radiatus]
MLNPDATEFKPVSSLENLTSSKKINSHHNNSGKYVNNTSQSSVQQAPSKPNRSQQTKKKNVSSAPSTNQQKSLGTTLKTTATVNIQNANQRNKSISSGSQQRHDKPSRRKQQQRQRGSHEQPTDSLDSIEQQPPTSFITLDHTIDPVHIVTNTLLFKNTVVHGYDRYVAWVERCLQTYPVVTMVGMDPVLADLISLVIIIQQKGIGFYHELETFSIQEGGRQPTSGIQVKLHRN